LRRFFHFGEQPCIEKALAHTRMLSAQPLSLKGQALRLLSAREYSRAELERKLKPKEEAPGELARALDELTARGFISEQRVIESVINRRSAKLGTARIRQELQSKGLDRDAVTEAVTALQTTELERAREVWRRKFDSRSDITQATPADRAKQMRFLTARGFGAEVIRRVVSGAFDEE